jgi:hypothetical protein
MISNYRTLDYAKGLDGMDVEAAKRDDRDPERWANFRKQTWESETGQKSILYIGNYFWAFRSSIWWSLIYEGRLAMKYLCEYKI